MSETEIQEEIARLAWKLLGSTEIRFMNDHFSIVHAPKQFSVALENPFRMVFMEEKNVNTGEVHKRLEPSLAEELLNRMRAARVLDELADI